MSADRTVLDDLADAPAGIVGLLRVLTLRLGGETKVDFEDARLACGDLVMGLERGTLTLTVRPCACHPKAPV